MNRGHSEKPILQTGKTRAKKNMFPKGTGEGAGSEGSCKMSVSNRNPSPPHYWDHMSPVSLIVYLPLVPSVCSRRAGMHVCLTHCCVP